MKIRLGKKYITDFKKYIPECNKKPFICRHDGCFMWNKGYRVSMKKIGLLKFLIWELPTVKSY